MVDAQGQSLDGNNSPFWVCGSVHINCIILCLTIMHNITEALPEWLRIIIVILPRLSRF